MATTLPYTVEWCEWNAPAGFITIEDGRRVEVRGGDLVLVEERPDKAVFLDHEPIMRH